MTGKNEIWFTATTSGSSRELRAVTLSGRSGSSISAPAL